MNSTIIDSYELTTMQKGILFDSTTAPDTGLYIMQLIVDVKSPFCPKSFKNAWKEMVKRHDVLRASFSLHAVPEPFLNVHSEVDIPFEIIDYTGKNNEKKLIDFEALLHKDRLTDFDITIPPIFRITVVIFSEDDWRCIWTVHHCIVDGRSIAIILEEVFDLYEAYSTASEYRLDDATPYKKFVKWINQINLDNHEAYWSKELREFYAPTPLVMSSIQKNIDKNLAWGGVQARLSSEETGLIKVFAQDNGVTLNTLIQTAWGLLLAQYSGQLDIVFGTTRTGRHNGIDGSEKTVGLFINTIPFRIKFNPDETLHSVIQTIRNKQIEYRRYEHAPLNQIQRWSEFSSRTPLFESLVSFDHFSFNALLKQKSGHWKHKSIEFRGQTNYPLLLLSYGDTELVNRIEYDPHRFSQRVIEQMHAHLFAMLRNFPHCENKPAIDVPYLSKADEIQLLSIHPERARPTISDCLHHRFEKIAESKPDKIALVFEDNHLTYRDLNENANIIANRLIDEGIKPCSLVGLHVDRSFETLIGILGILKAGCAYVPLDPIYPEDRISYIISDAKLKYILSTSENIKKMPTKDSKVVPIDDVIMKCDSIAQDVKKNPKKVSTPDDLCYVIYTSGSTGKPKGVLIKHSNVIRLFESTQAWFQFTDNDCWTLFHSYAFDFSVWEIWGALLYGGKLIIIPYWVSRSPETFRDVLIDEQVSVLNLTPSAFRQLVFVEQQKDYKSEYNLRTIIFGGEALELKSLLPWVDRYGDEQPKLVNMFGITETTVHVTYREINKKDILSGKGSVIGVPIPDLSLYVLDRKMKPVPVCVPGELYVGGAGLGVGYLNRPELTAERFINAPWGGATSERLYKTGDVARYLEDYDLEYIGRSDFQVKVRGFRIELGEIEAALIEHESVREALVITRDFGDQQQQLIAYLTLQKDRKIGNAELREHLKILLPEHMIPASFTVIEQFQLTENGKINRNALPPPTLSREELSVAYTPPENDIQAILCRIWERVLKHDRVGTNDDFFILGGDSIIYFKIISEAYSHGLKIDLKQIFEFPTIGRLWPHVERIENKQYADNMLPDDWFGISPVQQWFFNHGFENPDYWNQTFIFRLKRKLDLGILAKALIKLFDRHESLRLRFKMENDGWVQRYDNDHKRYTVDHKTIKAREGKPCSKQLQDLAEQMQDELDIEKGPIVSVAFVEGDEGYGDRLVMVSHHLVVDAVSWLILMEDLDRIYIDMESGIAPQAPFRTASYYDWIEDQKTYYLSEAFAQERLYWHKQSQKPVFRLPVELSDGSKNYEHDVASVTVSFSREETQSIQSKSKLSFNLKINEVFIIALSKTLSEWSGEVNIQLDGEGHGREMLPNAHDVSRTVGWFTSIYPINISIGEEDIDDLIVSIKKQIRTIPNNGIGYGIMACYDELFDMRDGARARRGVLLNYLGQIDKMVDNSELISFTSEKTGPWHGQQNHRTHLLEIIGKVVQQRLSFEFIYNQTVHTDKSMEKLSTNFKDSVLTIIERCMCAEKMRYSPVDFQYATVSQQEIDELSKKYTYINDILPLSPIQTLYYTMENYNQSIGFEQWVFEINGDCNESALQKSWQTAINQHTILRTGFNTTAKNKYLQIEVPNVIIPWKYIDLSHMDDEEKEKQIQQIQEDDKNNPFDLEMPPLSRVVSIKKTATKSILIWSTHHLIIDGWSWPLVLKHITSLYQEFISGSQISILQNAGSSYKDYIIWISNDRFIESRTFWKNYLHHITDTTPLMGMTFKGASHSDIMSVKSRKISFQLESETDQAIREYSKVNRVTVNTLLQAAWACCLKASSGGDDIMFGATFSGRPFDLEKVETIVGPFVNNLPVRVNVKNTMTIKGLIEALKNDHFNLNRYQHVPMEMIQKYSGIRNQKRLFNSLFVFQNYYAEDGRFSLSDSTAIELIEGPEVTNYPITVLAYPEERLRFVFIFQEHFFSEKLANAIIDDYKTALRMMFTNSGQSISDLGHNLLLWKQVAEKTHLDKNITGGVSGTPVDFDIQYTDIEDKIAGVWKAAFGVETINKYDNLFDLGAYSLMIINVHNELQKVFNRTFAITKMFQFPTIETLANFLIGSDNLNEATRDFEERKRRKQIAQSLRKQKRMRIKR